MVPFQIVNIIILAKNIILSDSQDYYLIRLITLFLNISGYPAMSPYSSVLLVVVAMSVTRGAPFFSKGGSSSGTEHCKQDLSLRCSA